MDYNKDFFVSNTYRVSHSDGWYIEVSPDNETGQWVSISLTQPNGDTTDNITISPEMAQSLGKILSTYDPENPLTK